LKLRNRLDKAEEQLLSGPHPDRARPDAEALARFVLGKNRAWLLSHLEEPVPSELEPQFSRSLARRATGEPIQYITGATEFYGLPFHVQPGVLIPRPETEHLVEEVLRLASQFPTPRVVDIGTGSGAIAIAIAHALPTARITATDLSPQTLAIARRNAEQNAVRIEFLQGDLLAPLTGRRFDILASNPPYIPASDRLTLSIEVRDHEPPSALFAGDDGLSIYRRLIPDAFPHLNAGGFLVMEIGYGQQPAIEALLNASSYTGIRLLPDYQGIPRVAVARRP
jgi:release factor glutamine methyltransferase